MPDDSKQPGWKGPTIHQIAAVACVGSSTVDRVLNNRSGVSEKTRRRVNDARDKLWNEQRVAADSVEIRLFCESGETFNSAMFAAEQEVNRSLAGIKITGHYVATKVFDPARFAQKILEDGRSAGGVAVVAREHPAVNQALRKLSMDGIPVVCLTSDLPSARRGAYIGNDQYAAGSVAGLLIGKALPRERQQMLLVMSVPFRCQQEREMGFRRVLRSDFPHLRVEDRVISDDDPETAFEQVRKYVDVNGPPAAVYNIGGANRGIARALEAAGHARQTVFVGHELTSHTRELLASGAMDYVISHDFASEVSAAVKWILDARNGVAKAPGHTSFLVHTRYNCGL